MWNGPQGVRVSLVTWATRQRPFCWFSVTAYAYSCGSKLMLCLLGCGFELTLYRRDEP